MIGIISQARINSSRLPNKIFLEAGGKPFLAYHIQRLRQTGLPVIIATTNNGSEKPIQDFCETNNIPCFCGDEQNVLKRYYDCAKEHKLTAIIRVTSDCPLIDPELISKGVAVYQQLNDLSYYSNTITRSYPRGMDYEIFSFRLLEEAFFNAKDEADKEHVTPYIWKNRSGKVTLVYDIDETDNSCFRITLDTEEDREFLTRLIEEHNGDQQNCSKLVTLLNEHPELVEINKEIEQKKI